LVLWVAELYDDGSADGDLLVPGFGEQLALLHRMFGHAFPGRRVFR
jgi:hypothetical protein